MVDPAIGDDHTDVPTQEIQQTAQKPMKYLEAGATEAP